MPWCPQCGTEYRSGFETCADCGCDLRLESTREDAPRIRRSPYPWLIASVGGNLILLAAYGAWEEFSNYGLISYTIPDWFWAMLVIAVGGYLFGSFCCRFQRPIHILTGWFVPATLGLTVLHMWFLLRSDWAGPPSESLILLIFPATGAIATLTGRAMGLDKANWPAVIGLLLWLIPAGLLCDRFLSPVY